MAISSVMGDTPVLVVDDERAIVRAVTRQLERASLQVTGFINPLEAREALTPGRFAVVVSDHMMPELPGLDLLRDAAARAPRTRRILLTGYADHDQAIEAFNRGVLHRFLRKPWEGDELLRVVREEAATFHEQTRTRTKHLDLERQLSTRTQLLRSAMAIMQDSDRAVLEASQEAGDDETARDATVLLADVVGYSRLMHDDAAATVQTLTAHQMVAIEAIVRHGGRVVNAPGDSLLAEFPEPEQAVVAAQAIQIELDKRNSTLPGARQMWLRIGIARGAVLVRQGDLFGDPVNIAARLQERAEPGGACIAESVWRTLPPPQRSALYALGLQHLRNIAEPEHAYVWHLHTGGREG